MAARLRLDELLVKRGFFASRSRARDAILRGTVEVSGRPVSKPGHPVGEADEIKVADPASAYVSRAALKLIHGLDRFGIDPAGCLALDIGASTGGFTQVLLERGASHVIAIDVGHGQMAEALRLDARVTLVEGLNARDLSLDHLGDRSPALIVCDVSFISLKLALPPALALAVTGAKGIFLIKPQFEAGRGRLSSGGILREPGEADRIAEDLFQWVGSQPGWRSLALEPSPIEGGDGNREFLLCAEKLE